jgi:hypothetical protein
MEAQQPATGILKSQDFGDCKSYKVSCECGNNDCIQNVYVEADEYAITVQISTRQTTSYWQSIVDEHRDIKNRFLEKQWYAIARWINGIYNRARITCHVWFKGYVTYESTTLLNQQQALNYAETLRQAVEDVAKIRSERVKKFQHTQDNAL